MDTILLIDRGNRSLKAAIHRDGAITEHRRIEQGDGGELIAEMLDTHAPAGIAFSSVVPAWNGALADQLRGWKIERIVEVGAGIRLPFDLRIKHPETLGADRIAAAAGAASLGHRRAVIIDAGTAVTVDLLSPEGFLGGAIFPGLHMLLQSLHTGTASLPRIDLDGPPPHIPGNDTTRAMSAGIFWGWVGAVREIIARSLKTLDGDPPVLFTGGDAHRLALHCAGDVTVDDDLVFRGLLHLYELNI